MKKYGWLIGGTVAAMALILAAGRVWRAQVPTVETVVLTRSAVEQTVQCTGKVEEATGDTMAVAAAGKKVQIRVSVPESRLRQVAVGQRVRVTGAAFGADAYGGTVTEIGAAAHTTASGGTVVDAVIALDTADETLRCGLTARAGICVARVEDGLLLPYECLCTDDGVYVYVYENGRAVRRAVQIEAELSDGALIAAGLEAGERVICTPDAVPGDGARVREGG